MNKENLQIISIDTLSVDIFKGERKITVIKDADYKELKFIKGEYQVNILSHSESIGEVHSLVVGIGGNDALNKAKEVALASNVSLMLIPIYPTAALLPFVVDDNCKIKNFIMPVTVVIVKDIINNQPRGKLAIGLECIGSMLINLVDEAFCRLTNQEECLAENILNVVASTLENIEKFSKPYQTIGEDICQVILDLWDLQKLDLCNPIIASYIFSLYKGENLSYNEYVFALSFAIFSVYYCYSPCAELLLPPDRLKIRQHLREYIAVPFVSINPHSFPLVSFILKDRYDDIIKAISHFPNLAKAYLRLRGNSGYDLREKYTAKELLYILTFSCEISNENSLLKHIYASGYLNL